MSEAIIMGEPIAKGRPRVVNGHAYTPQKTRDAEERIGWELKAAGAELDAEGRYGVSLRFVTRRRSDIDNLAKLVLDAANGVLWADDSQVDDLHITREQYGEPCTRIKWWVL